MEGESRDDIIIFGATGFTGKHVVEEMAKWVVSISGKQKESKGKKKANKSKPLIWGVAGRSLDKLNDVLMSAKNVTGYDTTNVKCYAADIDDPASLKSIASKCKVLLNCVGPYRFFGEQVVKACVEEGTSYVDVSGEPEFLENMQLKYHEEAEKKGIYIVGSCGFDSIPIDCGVTLLQQIFSKAEGEMNSVETFMELDACGGTFKINHATWKSAIHGVANASNLKTIRKELYKKERTIPAPTHKLQKRGPIHYNPTKIIAGYYLPFPGSDASVVRRSQRHFYYKENIRPAQMSAYVKVGSRLNAVMLIFFALVFGVLAQFKRGQNFLDKWASWITFGYITNEGPKDEEMKNVKFTMYLIGKGWESKLTSPDDKHTDTPNVTRSVKVCGTNPGYGATCVMLLHSALTILDESEKMPSKGGVYPPGAAFANTSLIHRLNENGVTFEEVQIPNV